MGEPERDPNVGKKYFIIKAFLITEEKIYVSISISINLHPSTCLLIFERRRGWERKRERNISVRRNINQLPLLRALTDMCCEWESNLQSFSLRNNAPTTLARAEEKIF